MGTPHPQKKVNMKMNIANLADGRVLQLHKTEAEKLRELKQLLIDGAGTQVVSKAVQIALNDEHPSQAAMIKLCLDRMLPVSMFEKDKNQRSAISITITGIGEVQHDVIDVEAKSE